MDIPSWRFLGFALVAALVYNLVRSTRWHRLVLLITNLLFLASLASTPEELLPLGCFLLLGFALFALVRSRPSRGVHVAAIVVVLCAFFWLKRYTFIPSTLFLHAPYLLIGLSYIFFRVLHLVIDAPDRDIRLPPIDYLNFTLNFTSLVSGPVQRFEDYQRTAVTSPLPLGPADIGEATLRIVTGLFKVAVMAVVVASMQRAVAPLALQGATQPVRATAAVLLMALFPVFLFFNFSGYTDFVIGVARLFRIELPENFDRPFRAASFIDYWSRWHMSLSNWLRTYVYNPLLMAAVRRNRDPRLLPYLGAMALFVTFFLVGAWHGRTTNFLFFGVLNGGGVAVNQSYRIFMLQRLGRKRLATLASRRWYVALGRGLTFTWVSFTLLWFWSDWLPIAQLAHAVGLTGLVFGAGALVLAAGLVLTGVELLERVVMSLEVAGAPLLRSRYVLTVWVTLMGLGILAVQSATQATAPDIVYKDF